MEAGLLAQYVAVGLAVMASAAYVAITRFPRQARRARGWCAMRLIGSGHPALARIGRRIAPAPTARACGACDGCD